MEVLRCAINFMRLGKKIASKHIDLKAFEWTHFLLQKPKSDFQGGLLCSLERLGWGEAGTLSNCARRRQRGAHACTSSASSLQSWEVGSGCAPTGDTKLNKICTTEDFEIIFSQGKVSSASCCLENQCFENRLAVFIQRYFCKKKISLSLQQLLHTLFTSFVFYCCCFCLLNPEFQQQQVNCFYHS